MNARDHLRIEKAVAEIRRLITLETAHFGIVPEKDTEIKNAIRPWLTWIKIEADTIDNALHGAKSSSRSHRGRKHRPRKGNRNA